MKEHIQVSYCTNISHQSITLAGLLVNSQLILFDIVMTCPVRDSDFQTSIALSLKKSLLSLTCIPCCLNGLGSRISCLLSLSLPHPIPKSLVFRLLYLPLATSGEVCDGFAKSKEVQKQRSFPNAFSFFQLKLHVCVCVYIVYMWSTTLITGDETEAKHTETATAHTALAPPCRGGEVWRCAWAPLASGVLHCLWSEIVT